MMESLKESAMHQSLNLSTLYTADQIQKRIQELGVVLTDKLKGKEVVAVCVLKGSFMFFSDLIREIDTDLECDFFGVSSYQNSHKSSGEVKLTLDLNLSIRDKHVVLIEDIVDTGLTMQYLQQNLKLRGPASLNTVALLSKPSAHEVDFELDHFGFEIANDFVVGYGLDYQGQFRNLPYIALVQSLN
jgi:hypoxanthine phosphoribosyltransferase